MDGGQVKKENPWRYVALLRTPGGLVQKASINADSLTHAHHTIRELWPALRLIRITKEGCL